MNVHFFRRDGQSEGVTPALLSGLTVRCWQPDVDGYPPRGFRTLSNQFWWTLARCGGFEREGFAELLVERDGRLLHRLIVTPAWYRFPFMAPDDLQIGNLWTAPDARRNQLARAAIEEAHSRFGKNGSRFWYVADAHNEASEALARSCGYELVATGRRMRRFGVRLLGQYVIDHFV